MFNFRNDYHDLCHPKVLDALLRLQDEGNVGYGYDAHTERAAKLIAEATGTHAAVHFVPGGTAANTLAITFHLRPHECVISADSGHIVADEVGAVEAAGHKIVTVETADGKFDAGKLEEVVAGFGSFHNVLPGMIYLSNATETGLVYKKRELADIRAIADTYGLLVYIDGARMGSALASEACDVTLADYPAFADIFSIGGTKNGALFGEALVFSDPSLADEFIYFQKQRSLLMAKGFTLGAQFEALFEDGLYFDIARDANVMAKKLDTALRDVGYAPLYPFQSNQIFVNLPKDKVDALAEVGQFERIKDGEYPLIRLVTTYATKDEEIQSLIALLKK